MCLIALAHRASSRFPFVLAANRDEEYARASREARFWEDAPSVLGGRDELRGGSWLAVSRRGRFAAVTNLRGAQLRERSRGALVRELVTGDLPVERFAAGILRVAEEYSGFHLLAGEVGGEAMYIAPWGARPLTHAVHGVSNAPEGEAWPKVGLAVEAMHRALEVADESALVEDLMQFLTTPRGTRFVESEVFIAGDRYGTRSSTVVVARAGSILFAEQNFGPGGAPLGERRTFRFELRAS
jgi:uncharacterized protein with NRDE domain